MARSVFPVDMLDSVSRVLSEMVIAAMRGPRIFRFVAAAILWAIGPECYASFKPPTPLQDSTCALSDSIPIEGGHALFRYTVAQSGLVHMIRPLYVSTQPESVKDQFARELSRCMSRWRYMPATYNGRPLEMRLLLPFHYFSPAPPDAPTLEWRDGRDIPESHVREIRQEKIRMASVLMSGKNYVELSGPGWTLQTDVSPRDRQYVVETIESAAKAFNGLFARGSPADEPSRVAILLFRTIEEFNQVAAFDNVKLMQTGLMGEYSRAERMAYLSMSGQTRIQASQVLAHELAHHLVYERLYLDGREAPPWVSEGIATYIGLLRLAEEGPADPRHVRLSALSENYLLEVERGLGQAGLSALRGLLAGQWSGSEFDYALSWILVHYLMVGEEGRHRAGFIDWLHGQKVALDPGGTIEQLHAALKEHHKTVKPAN